MSDDAALREELERRNLQLQAAEERFRNLIVRNVDAIVVVDGGGTVRFGNPAAEILFGRSADDLVGAPFGFPLLIGETTEIDVIGSSGSPAVAEMRVVETEWEGEPALLAVLRDISERKRAEAERAELLREQVARAEAEQAIRERDEFMAVASHELRTPLSTLALSAQFLRRRLERHRILDPTELLEALRRQDEQARRISRIVEHVLDVSRISVDRLAVDRRAVDLRALIDRAVERFRTSTARHTITVRGPARVDVVVDPARIEQVVTSLLDNAIRYSPDGGPIDVELAAMSEESPEVQFAVKDHGLGIPPERRSRLFERFYQAHVDGHRSGLGLSLFISRRIVELHGGQIRAVHPTTGGTCFEVTLPRTTRAD